METKIRIQKLVAENKIKDALEVFQVWAVDQKDVQLQNSLILIQAKFARLKQQENLGIIQFSEALREQAIITHSILEFLSQVKVNDTQPGGIPNPEDGRKVILFLASNPSETSKLQLEKEFVRIFNGIQEGTKDLRLVSEWAVTPGGLQQAILKHRPNVIHFAGHGAAEKPGSGSDRDLMMEKANSGGILLHDASGNPKLVNTRALANLFETMLELDGMDIELVILNACHQEEQAKAISKYVPFVIGTKAAIGDDVAIEFSTGFYRGLATANSNIKFAFLLAKNNIMLEDLEESQVPVIYERGKV